MPDVVDAAISTGMFNKLVEAVKAAGLVDTLKDKGPYTVFAPTDEAFSKVPQETINMLKNDIPKLRSILTYHVVSGKFTVADLSKIKNLKTVEGENVKIDSSRWHIHKNPKINDANIVQPDIMVDNGVCHAIDKVLMPEMTVKM